MDLKYDPSTDPRFITADGYPITDGMAVWTNDLRPTRVFFARERNLSAGSPFDWDGWFSTDDGTINGERMAVRHPSTREYAETAAMRKENHVDYPHAAGRLYDCPACESACYCRQGETECVYDGSHRDVYAPAD